MPLKQSDWRWDNAPHYLFRPFFFPDPHPRALYLTSSHCSPQPSLSRSSPLSPRPHISILILLRLLLLAHCHSSSTLIKILGTFNIHMDDPANILSFQVLKILSSVHLSHPLPQSHPGLCHLSKWQLSGSLLYPTAYLISPLSCGYLKLSTSKTKLNPPLRPTPTAIFLSQLRLLTEPHPFRPMDQSLYFSSKPISTASLVAQW